MSGGDPTTELLAWSDASAQDNEIREFLDVAGGHYRHSFEWVECAGDTSACQVATTRYGGRLTAVSFLTVPPSRIPFLRALRIERGPVYADSQSLATHLNDVKGLVARRFTHLSIQPDIPDNGGNDLLVDLAASGWTRATDDMAYADTVIVPVLPADEKQWKTLRRSTRTSINRTFREDLTVRLSESRAAYLAFAERFSAFARVRGIAPLSTETANCIHSKFAHGPKPGSYLISISGQGQEPGAILLMANRQSLVYEWGWTAQAESGTPRLPVMHRLIWEALQICRRQGFDELDLGGYWLSRGNDDPINHFKLGFSKKTRHCGHEWRYSLSPTLYRLRRFISSAWKR